MKIMKNVSYRRAVSHCRNVHQSNGAGQVDWAQLEGDVVTLVRIWKKRFDLAPSILHAWTLKLGSLSRRARYGRRNVS